LDGDREELRNIKHDLASLRIATLTQNSRESENASPTSKEYHVPVSVKLPKTVPVVQTVSNTARTGLTSQPKYLDRSSSVNDSLVSHTESELLIAELLRDQPPIPQSQFEVADRTPAAFASNTVEANISRIENEITELLRTGRYSLNDPAIVALMNEKANFEVKAS